MPRFCELVDNKCLELLLFVYSLQFNFPFYEVCEVSTAFYFAPFSRRNSKRTTLLSRKVILSDDLIFYPGAAFLKNCLLIPPGSDFHRGPSLRGGRVFARTEGFVSYYHSPILGGRIHELCKNSPQHSQFMIKSIFKETSSCPESAWDRTVQLLHSAVKAWFISKIFSTISSRKQKVNTSHVCWRLSSSWAYFSSRSLAHLRCKHLSYSPMT